MLSNRQKSLISRQKADEEDTESLMTIKVTAHVGDTIEFEETPEFNGKVVRISNDQWKMIVIDYGVAGHSKVLNPTQLMDLINKGKAKLIPAPKDEISKNELEKIKKSMKKSPK